eukprot:3611537-Rhodomonas_salina.3
MLTRYESGQQGARSELGSRRGVLGAAPSQPRRAPRGSANHSPEPTRLVYRRTRVTCILTSPAGTGSQLELEAGAPGL